MKHPGKFTAVEWVIMVVMGFCVAAYFAWWAIVCGVAIHFIKKLW